MELIADKFSEFLIHLRNFKIISIICMKTRRPQVRGAVERSLKEMKWWVGNSEEHSVERLSSLLRWNKRSSLTSLSLISYAFHSVFQDREDKAYFLGLLSNQQSVLQRGRNVRKVLYLLGIYSSYCLPWRLSHAL